jgi:glyoxylate/hydroxypyruvate reductase A
MRILFYAQDGNAERWLESLQRALPRAKIREWQSGDTEPADYAIVWKPPAEMLHGRTGLKAVFNLGAGVDAIMELGEALPQGVPIVRLDDAGMGVQMAEYVTYAVLRYFRRFDEYDVQARRGEWKFIKPRRKENFRIGLMGLGVLGTRVAQSLAHFEFPLSGWSQTPKEVPGVDCHVGAAGLDPFLRASNVLVCMLPLTADTAGILNRANLEKLPPNSYLINVGRGAHVVEADLLELVQIGHIAGATLDVFGHEPLPPAHPFWKEPEITITPHVAALTVREESMKQIADKIRALEQGSLIRGIVDRLKGY